MFGRFFQVLPIIVISQFLCTSLWFAGNGVMTDLVTRFNLPGNTLEYLTSAVQLGFIFGTLIFAVFTVADRYSPSKVFFVSALSGALFNLGTVWEGNHLYSLLCFRFLTGFFLAGIYPVGMKIAADYYERGLGRSLGFLVGALVLGTAFPHFLKGITAAFNWKSVLVSTSLLALCGGVLMLYLIPDGPYRKSGGKVDFSAFLAIFRNRPFRQAALGYFGHMWELYAFWAFVPLMLGTYRDMNEALELNVPLVSFCIIAVGGLACVLAGYLSQYMGAKRTAFTALLLSCICCLVSPLLFLQPSATVFIGFLLFWGMVVIADSPLFSTLVARNALPKIKGTALTMVNSIGFAVTILSIQFLGAARQITSSNTVYMLLALGPVLGLWAMYGKNHRNSV
ncbi:MAG: MFS transporter [Bacteroidota bacterium]